MVEERNVYAAKNLMRFLAIGVEYGVISAQAFSQTLLQLLDEAQTGAGGKLKGASDQEIVLEALLAALPIIVS